MEFIVEVREVWIQPVEIEAVSEKEAIEKVREGEGKSIEDGFEYSHTLSTDKWTVHELEVKVR